MPLLHKQLLQFGDFVLEPAGRSLTRHGERITLSRRSFDLLCYMAQHPGEVLSRERLLENVWPDTHVDENSLSQSVSALRRALEEKPGENTYIATVPGRGYQFLLPVTGLGESTPPGLSSEAGHVVIEERAVSQSVVTRETRTSRRRRGLVAAAVVGTGALAAAAAWFWASREPRPEGHITAVIADLENDTGDPEFDHTLNKVLQIDLQQSPYFTVVSEGRARHTLKMMLQDPAERITAPLARDICQRVNGQVYIVPTIARIGDSYSLTMQLGGCAPSSTLDRSHRETADKNGVLAAWSDLTRRMRRDAGESWRSMRTFDKPLYEEPTASLDALRAYGEATRVGDAGRFKESIALYQHAIDLDPNFAVAYADMSTMYYNNSDEVHSKWAITRAYEIRRVVNEREQLYIEFRYAQTVTGDLEKSLDVLHTWASMYPQDNLPLANLVNFETWTGHYPEAASWADRVIAMEDRMNIHNGISYEIAARAYHHANMPDKLRAVYAEAMQWKVDSPGLHGVLLEFAAENGDQAEVDRQIAWSRNTPNEAHLLQEAGMAALAAGQAKKADALMQEARRAAARDKIEDSLPDLDDYYARMLVEMGLKDRARDLLRTLPHNDPSLDLAFAQAALGQAAPALAAAQHMHAESPQDTLVNAEYVPSVQAILELQKNHGDAAVQLLEGSSPYELRDPTVPYLRGQAFLSAHKPALAAVEFTKIAARPWIDDPQSPLSTLAYLGLAQAAEQQQNDPAALDQYKRFLAAWTAADPDLPVLRTAREAVARLQHSPAASHP